MAAPAVAAAAVRVLPRVARIAGRVLKRARVAPRPGAKEEKPSIFSVAGIVLITVAVLADLVNIILVVLDMALGLGTVVAIVINLVVGFFLGGLLFFLTGKLPIKKALLPFGLNSLPLVRIIPFWLISVLFSLRLK